MNFGLSWRYHAQIPSGKGGQGTVGQEIERQIEARPEQAAIVCTGLRSVAVPTTSGHN